MYYYGSFVTQLGETITVHIVTENNRTTQVEIGNENSDVFFTTDPVEIENSVNDTFDHLLRSQATIKLLVRDFISDFFCASCMNAVVNIFKGDKCIFAGFIVPQTYSQNYNEVFDELEISCIDVLSALQYSKYRNVDGLNVLYEDIKANAGQLTFGEIAGNILNSACANIDITGTGAVQFYFDGSKSLNVNADRYNIFNEVAISELLFLGEEEDDVWQSDKVLEAILKYLNLHIVQDGLQFYIFSWESIKEFAPISWQEMTTGDSMTTNRGCVGIDLSNTASNDTTISIGEIFNQISLTCKIESVENVIKSPLDSDSLLSPYSNKQKYLTEFSSDGEGVKAYNAFYNMCHDIYTDYDGGVITDWYIQVKNNPMWVFPEPGTGENMVNKYCKDNSDQQLLPNRMAVSPCAAIVSLGKIVQKTDHKDNSPVSRIDMTDYFVISVNSNGSDDKQSTYPNEESLKNNAPCAIYEGTATGCIYSPSDSETTNYIVISGSILLNPIMDFTNDYKTLRVTTTWDESSGPSVWHKTVPSRNDEYGRYYTQKYYRVFTPSSTPIWDSNTARGLVPFTETGPEQYEFKYSAIGDSTDKISKVSVLACMLIIGDKCVVEIGTSGHTSDLVWRTYKTREQCANDDEYYQQSFTIGFDPKIGDKLIGTEFKMQNNIDYTLGIDAEGIAIPIRKRDKISGPVQFMILGPVNSTWGEITRRHRTWFRSEKWSKDVVPLMAHVSSIFMKSFEIKIYSDNGLINNPEDNDIVYISDTHETFVNRKDDLKFEISSALTSAECQQLGVSDTIKLSTPIDLSTGYGLLSIFDQTKSQQAKPEQLYVDSYYSEYHKPRILMVHKLEDRADNVSLFNLYKHPAMANKLFYVQGISRNLIEGYAELTIKEVWDD